MVRRARLAQGTPREYRSASIRFTVCTIPSRHAARCEVSFRAVRASSPAPAELVSFPSRASTRSFPPLPFPHRPAPTSNRASASANHTPSNTATCAARSVAPVSGVAGNAHHARSIANMVASLAAPPPDTLVADHRAWEGVEIPRVELMEQRPREDDAHEVALEERGGHLAGARRDEQTRRRRVWRTPKVEARA